MLLILCWCLVSDSKKLRTTVKYLNDTIGGLQKTLSGKKSIESLNVEKLSDILLNGLVEKKTTGSGNRTISNFTTTDKVPKFGSVREALTFASGVLYSSSDPTIGRVEPWGPVVKSDDYAALRVAMQEVLNQIKSLIATGEGNV